MGVLTDYFRAADRTLVEKAMLDSTFSPINRDPGFDGVQLKAIDDAVLLGQLVAAITGATWTPDLTGSVPVYPPAHTQPEGDDGWADLPEDSPWATGPWVTELDEPTRDALATVDSGRIPEVAATWITSEEFDGAADLATAEDVIRDLQALAQRARQADEKLYCWMSL